MLCELPTTAVFSLFKPNNFRACTLQNNGFVLYNRLPLQTILNRLFARGKQLTHWFCMCYAQYVVYEMNSILYSEPFRLIRDLRLQIIAFFLMFYCISFELNLLSFITPKHVVSYTLSIDIALIHTHIHIIVNFFIISKYHIIGFTNIQR